jgi:uncharacterized protein with FMN-binding domain
VLATVSGLVLLVSYHTSTMGAGTAVASGAVSRSPAAGPVTPTTGAGAPAGAAPAGGDTVITGAAASTRRGPVQVQVTIRSGRIVDIVALAVPDRSGRDQRINASAVPILRDEALSAQSANIDTVSGATITSDGYIQSLQSALDRAHLGGA